VSARDTTLNDGTTKPVGPLTGTSRRNLLLTFRNGALATLVGYSVNLALLPFVLHRVGPELYGAWTTIAALLAVGGLADAGVRTEVVRRVGAANGAGDDGALVMSVHQGVTLLAVLAGTVCLAGLAVAPVIRSFAFPAGVPGYGGSEVDSLVRATIVLLGLTILANGYFGVLRGMQRGDVETRAVAAGLIAGAGTTVLAVTAGWGLWALFAGSAAQAALSFGWQWRGTRRLVPALHLRLVRLRGVGIRAYLALSGLALMAQVSDVVDNQLDKLVLSHVVGSSAVASFQIGTSLVLQAKVLAVLPLAPLLVAIAELRGRNHERMEQLERVIVKATAVLTSVILGSLFVFAPAFLSLWLGPGQGAAGLATRLFVVAMAINLSAAPLAFHAFGEGWHRLAATGAVANMVVNGVLSVSLTFAVGFNGALYGSIGGNLVGAAVFFVLMRRRMGMNWAPPPMGALTVGVSATALAVFVGVGNVHTWPTFVASAAVYGAIVLAACAAVERLPLASLVGRAPVEPRPA
jgi:O-antigen/teichoic acid export membrane protein